MTEHETKMKDVRDRTVANLRDAAVKGGTSYETASRNAERTADQAAELAERRRRDK
jgi:hypothetical protein